MMRIDSDSIEWDLLEPNRIPAQARLRLSDSVVERIPKALLAEREEDGWALEKQMKRGVRVRKLKTHDVQFEDKVWATLAKLGFVEMNLSRQFKLPYGPLVGERKQIDVFAADEEVVLIVECKSAATSSKQTLKSEVESMQGTRPGLIQAIKSRYPTHKIKFILATSNILLTEDSKARVQQADIMHLDEDAIDYYLELAEHLGNSAKYQLLGALFAGTKIPGMDSKVPALQSRMGGHTYFSFAIEPARLLKLSYILHRNQANSSSMPSYQRLIKRTRLKKVAGFVDGGGFFPNSIIVNIDAGDGKLQFDRLSQDIGESRAGILHLPQKYRAAYIIDGQHRLYGYGDSTRADSDLIPVVAFVNLPQDQQVELFMQINENQQAVPKNLRSTLNADLLWNSDDLRERNRALRLRVSQRLGETKTAPLLGRVILGEEKRTPLRCVTIDAVSNGLLRSSFIGTFTKTEMKEPGTFYRGSNDNTFEPLADFLTDCFHHARARLAQQWDLGGADGGFVFINNGVEALTRLVGDIVLHLQSTKGLNPRVESSAAVFEKVKPMFDVALDYLGSLDSEKGRDLRRQYGSAGVVKYLRKLQVAVNAKYPEFLPEGFEEYLVDEAKQYNDLSGTIIAEVEAFLHVDVRRRLQNRFQARFFKDGVPAAVYTRANELAVEKNRTLDPEDEVEPWDCLFLPDYQKILQKDFATWEDLFADRYTKPGDEGKSWRKKTDWMSELVRIRNDNAHGRPVREEDYNFLVALQAWLSPGEDVPAR